MKRNTAMNKSDYNCDVKALSKIYHKEKKGADADSGFMGWEKTRNQCALLGRCCITITNTGVKLVLPFPNWWARE